MTRVEWEVKPKRGGFEAFEDFYQLSRWTVVELLNYLVKWGRLCNPNPADSNNRRWDVAELWRHVLEAVEDWADGDNWPTSRLGKQFKGINDSYLRGVAGTMSGAMARLNMERPNLGSMLTEMEDRGIGLKRIHKDAEDKAEIFKRI